MKGIDDGSQLERPVWFGASSRPLFGWLTEPGDGQARGGVLLAPPVAREARPARRALRRTAVALAARGFVSLRFDYRGTGDSSGDLEDADLDRAWIDSVASAVALLRSCELHSVSAVGMRLGATILGAAAGANDLGLSSLVLWDPCDSGRSYLRELGALEALRRDRVEVASDGSVETAEFVFSPDAATAIRRLKLSSIERTPLAERVLVLARPDRPIVESLRARLDLERVEWDTAPDQSPLLDVDPLAAKLPEASIGRLVDWLSLPSAARNAFKEPTGTTQSIVLDDGATPVVERCVRLGPNALFGIVTEPPEERRGPLVIFLNVANEEHTGPSRLWVELARRWATAGLECVRFDLSGLGDSPLRLGDPDPELYDQRWLTDMTDVAGTLRPEDPADTVFVGLCSGGYLAVEAGLALRSTGVCAINPPVGINFLYGSSRMADSKSAVLRAVAAQLKRVALHLRWVAVVALKVLRYVLPMWFSTDTLASVARNGTGLFLLASTDDVSPVTSSHRYDRFFSPHLLEPEGFEVVFVPGLDHSMHAARGRRRAIELLEAHVLTAYAGRPTGELDPSDDHLGHR
jgi:alpha-beta hydrolase superfamily lysophospholipase